MQASDLLFALPYVVLAIVAYGIVFWRRGRAKSFLAQAIRAQESGKDREAILLLRQALDVVGQHAQLEREILDRLVAIYRVRGIAFDPGHYEALIGQCEVLRRKGSDRALAEMKDVRKLKRLIVAKMPVMG